MADKYFMLTAVVKKEGRQETYADVYDDFSKLKQSYNNIKGKITNLQAWLLTPVKSDEDFVIAKVNNKWFACLGQKKELKGDNFVKVIRQEIRIK